MIRNALIFVLCSPLLCFAQATAASKLQCDGTYTDYVSTDMRNVPIKGIYVEVSEKKVKIVGAPGFDSPYVISSNAENGVGLQAVSNGDYQGFLNRFSGELSLTQRFDVKQDGTWKVKTAISAVCKKATPLF